MKIGVLTSSEGWHFQDLKRAAGPQHEIVQLCFSNLGGTIQKSCDQIAVDGHQLSTFDCILVRAMPPGSLEQVVARMDLLYRLERSGVPVINPSKSIEAAVDKYLSLCRLQDAGIATPVSAVFQTAEDAFHFYKLHNSDVVYKPLFGSEGRGLLRLSDDQTANQTFQQLISEQRVIYVQEFVPDVVKDLRLLVIGQQVYGMSRHNEFDWRKNISLGGHAVAHQVTPHEKSLAIRCAKAVGTNIAGVDVLQVTNNRYVAIEVNSSPGWQMLSRTLDVDIAAEIMRYLKYRSTEE